ncbi:MAG: tetratricopeptide repeat protein, partial [Flavobacteriaceae bacterium]|nr:tetratricopeptide repeat protein [Flavobacteriaceae bacterium]
MKNHIFSNRKTTFIHLLLAVFICLSTIVNAQNDVIDSLKSVVQKADKDTAMVSLYIDLSKEVLSDGNIPESLEYAEKALNLSNELDYAKGKALALKWAGIGHYYQGNYKQVLDYWTRSLESFSAIKDTVGMANMLGNIGVYHHEQGDKLKALDQYLKSLKLSEKINDSNRTTTNLNNIGGLYVEMKEYDTALEYFDRMEGYVAILDDPDQKFNNLMGFGETYLGQKDYENALKYFEEALKINENALTKIHNMTMLGKVEFHLGHTKKAISYLNAGLIAAKENDQKPEIVEALLELGNIYRINDPEKAKELYEEAELIADEMGAIYDLRDIYLGKYQIYASKEDYKKAYQYQSRYLSVKDSLSNVERDNKIGNLQLNFDLEKKEDEIDILEKEAKITELQGKRQKNMTYATVAVLVLVVLMALALYKRYRFINKTKKVIEIEKNRSENLLLNILPQETATELKQNGKVAAKQFDLVSVMFTDFKEFTSLSNKLTPEDLVKSVDFYFSKFDDIMEKYGLEKIKTIGDAYMCAG